MSQLTIFQLCWDGSSWVEPVSTKQGLMCLAQRHTAVTPVRFEPATPRSRVKHSTTEPLRFLVFFVNILVRFYSPKTGFPSARPIFITPTCSFGLEVIKFFHAQVN